MSNKIIAIIPARYESSRFPGKPLAIINGKPMIQRVYEQTSKAFNDVCVATDDMRIFETVEKFGGKAIMTSKSHRSGTDRCLEAYYKYIGNNKNNSDIVINVQGDEPYIHPEQLCELSNCFNDDNIQIATLVKKIHTTKELFNNNSPKVILDKNNFALYFSRAPIPFSREHEIDDNFIEISNYYRHIGLYGYRATILEQICNLPESFLEKTEKLEQLRWLENGYKIKTALTEYETYAVDTPEDMALLNSKKLSF